MGADSERLALELRLGLDLGPLGRTGPRTDLRLCGRANRALDCRPLHCPDLHEVPQSNSTNLLRTATLSKYNYLPLVHVE